MSTRNRKGAALLLGMALASMLASCEREKRDFDPPQGRATAPHVRAAATQPGAQASQAPANAPEMPDTVYTVDGNAYAVSQGKRLFHWYNCGGCHATGGGGSIGPALSDGQWLYGSRPQDIYASIVQGRPRGMPSFGTHIPQDQVWDLVAYVRSLSGQLRSDVASGRSDGMSPGEPEGQRQQEAPSQQKADDGRH